MSKGPWEARVKDLFGDYIAYYHKCPDRIASGRARLDYIIITKNGVGGIIEVKEARKRKTDDWKAYASGDSSCISPLQWMEMEQAYKRGVEFVVIAVGIEDKLYMFDFQTMSMRHGKEQFWPLSEAYWTYTWLGPKEWKIHSLDLG